MEKCMKSMDRKRKGKVEYLRKLMNKELDWMGRVERKSKRDSDLDVHVHVHCRIRKNINCLG